MATLPFKLDKKTIALVLSVALNLLGGTGTIPPINGTDCPPSPASPPAH